MPIGAAIGAAGSLASAGIGAIASGKASSQQVAAQQNALATQQSMFNSGLDFQKSTFGTAKDALNPFISAGSGVLSTLQNLITPGAAASTLSTLPGFQFQSQYGTQAATNALAARGLGGSTGPLARGISDYNQGLAGTYYNNSVNALQGFANMGSGAAGTLAGAAGQAGSNVGGLTASGANAIGNTLTGIGNAQAAGTLGTANALAGGLTGGANSATNALLLSRLTGGGSGASGLYGKPLAEASGSIG